MLRPKPDGRAARLAIFFIEATSKDPAEAVHEGFLELILPHTTDVRRFPADTPIATVADYLQPG